jgi:putative alpha-1,2-mannosidase
MPQFTPDQVTFNDLPGYGAWDIGHGREHLQFVQVLSQATPPVNIPAFDLLSFLTAGQARDSILQSHAQHHVLIHAALGITSIDLAAVNLSDENDFYNWTGYHASTHAAIRQALGLI